MAIDPNWLEEYFEDGLSWLDGSRWDRLIASSQNEVEARAALKSLRTIFQWKWITEQVRLGKSHPVVKQQTLWGGARELLELGVVLTTYPALVKTLTRRLRDPVRYGACAAELHVGLLLSEAGARLVHETASPGGAPDWRAIWPNVEVDVEVKEPRISTHAARTSAIELEFMFALQRHMIGVVPTHPARLTFQLEPQLMNCWTTASTDRAAVDRVAQTTAVHLAAALTTPTAATRFPVDGVGYFDVELVTSGPTEFQFSGVGTIPDAQRELAKLRKTLRKAARRLQGSSGARIVALHLGQDALVGNYVSELQTLLHVARWGCDIDGLLLIGALNPALERCNYLVRGPSPRDALAAFVDHLPSPPIEQPSNARPA